METAPTPKYLEILSNYILAAMTKEEKRETKFLTENRMVTIRKHETSLEGLMDKFEGNEDGVYGLFGEADKSRYLTPKIEITAADIAEVPGLSDIVDAIHSIEERIKTAQGRDRFILKQTLIELRREQYILKNSYRCPVNITPTHGGGRKHVDLAERRYINEAGEPESTGLISLFKEDHVSALLIHYPLLKETTVGQFDNDFLYLTEEFEALVARALTSEHPHYYDIVKMKWENKQNIEIKAMLQEKYNIIHTAEYISCLWRSKIPKIIAQ